MKKKVLYIGLAVILIVILAFIIVRSKRFLEIDGCLDKGGRWDYALNECDCYSRPDSSEEFDNYWYTAYDLCLDEEILLKGNNIDQNKSTQNLVDKLNKRKALCKIKLLETVGDTVKIEILNDQILTEQMGSTGAYCYLAETVFTLTENDSIGFVSIMMEVGSHASPGIYYRDDFKDLIKTGANTK